MDESANHIALRGSQPGAADRVREESLPEQIRSISAQIKPIAELPALWADLGVVSENVDQLLPRLQGAYGLGDTARPGTTPGGTAPAQREAAAEHGLGGGAVQPAGRGHDRAVTARGLPG